MAISKTKLKSRVDRKTNPVVAVTLSTAIKYEPWRAVAQILSGSARNYASLNLSHIDKHTKMGDTVVIVGKVLASGELTKKVRICSLSISQGAREKLKKTKSEYVSILQEINANQKAAGIKLLR